MTLDSRECPRAPARAATRAHVRALSRRVPAACIVTVMQVPCHARDDQHARTTCNPRPGSQSAAAAAAAGGGSAGLSLLDAGAIPVQRPEVLQQLYATIEPLGVYLERVLSERPTGAPLLQDGNPQDYRYVLERCLVARPAIM